MSTSSVQTTLGLRLSPVAVAFLDSIPSNLPRWEGGAVPAGCAFWRKAQEGQTFYTVPSDHHNCAVGAYTHNIALPEERAAELQATVGFMVENNYIRMEEVARIPRLNAGPAAIAYGPVGAVSFRADMVIAAVQPAQAMLLFEAAVRAGVADSLGAIGRPACAALPLAEQTGGAALSLGCRGNRTFTGLPDDEMYIVIPGARWHSVAAELTTISQANETMGQHYAAHKATFPDL